MFLEIINNIRIVKSFSTEKKEFERYENRLDKIFKFETKTILKTKIFQNIIRGMFVLVLLMVLKLGYYWLLNSGITKGDLTSFAIFLRSSSDLASKTFFENVIMGQWGWFSLTQKKGGAI